MRQRRAARTAGFGTSIFAEMSRLALEHGAINLGQGFPDFEAPAFVKDAAVRAIAAGHNQYAASPGLPRLRREIAANWQRRFGVAVDPDTEVTVAAGATEGLFDATMALLDPGDEAIVFEPFYDAYAPNVLMAGGVPRFVRLQPPDWTFDPDALTAAFGPRTKLIVINTPHNPTGKVWTEAELDLVAGLCQQHDVMAITDEVYSEILFDGRRHVSLATRPGMRERTLVVDSFGKSFSVTGWKIGWVIAPAPLTAAFRAVHQFVTFCSPTPFQEAAADALAHAATSGYYEDLRTAYTARRALLTQVLTDAGLPPLATAGAFFLMADVRPAGFSNDVDFCRHLVTKVGVAAIPPSSFYGDPTTGPALARFCFAKRDETMRAAADRLRGFVTTAS